MQLLILVHKYLFYRSTLPEAYSEYFIANTNIHNYNARCKDDIHLNSCKLSYGHRCIKSKAASLWNAVPVELKNNMSVNMFKKKLSCQCSNAYGMDSLIHGFVIEMNDATENVN
jgi:hypothetical protein